MSQRHAIYYLFWANHFSSLSSVSPSVTGSNATHFGGRSQTRRVRTEPQGQRPPASVLTLSSMSPHRNEVGSLTCPPVRPQNPIWPLYSHPLIWEMNGEGMHRRCGCDNYSGNIPAPCEPRNDTIMSLCLEAVKHVRSLSTPSGRPRAPVEKPDTEMAFPVQVCPRPREEPGGAQGAGRGPQTDFRGSGDIYGTHPSQPSQPPPRLRERQLPGPGAFPDAAAGV